MSHSSDATACAHSREQRAIANARCTEQDVLTIGQVVGRIDASEVLFVAVSDEIFSLLLIARPHSALHIAAETFDRRCCQHSFRRTANTHVKVYIWLRQ